MTCRIRENRLRSLGHPISHSNCHICIVWGKCSWRTAVVSTHDKGLWFTPCVFSLYRGWHRGGEKIWGIWTHFLNEHDALWCNERVAAVFAPPAKFARGCTSVQVQVCELWFLASFFVLHTNTTLSPPKDADFHRAFLQCTNSIAATTPPLQATICVQRIFLRFVGWLSGGQNIQIWWYVSTKAAQNRISTS